MLTNPPIVAQYVRVLPVTWYSHISLRVDFYGCIPGKEKHVLPIFPDNKQVLEKLKRFMLSVEALVEDGTSSLGFVSINLSN